METKTPAIKAAALKTFDGTILSRPIPARHKDLIMDALRSGSRMGSWTDGFVTTDGEFVTRSQAASVARSSGQLPADFQGVLTTEDLWDNDGNPVVTESTDKTRYAIDVIRNYEVSMDDNWRNDFEEDGQSADELRREHMIQEIMGLLDIDEDEADRFYEKHRRD